MAVKKILLSQQINKIQKQYLKKEKLIKQFHSFIIPVKVEVHKRYNLELRDSTPILYFLQKWLSNNENHFKITPIFSNKPPLSPALSKIVQECKQIDLMDVRSMSVTKNGVEHNYILSLLDDSHKFWNSGHYPAKIPMKY